MSAIQCLDILIDPTEAALPFDDPTVPLPTVSLLVPSLLHFVPQPFSLVTDPGATGFAVRRHGSGHNHGGKTKQVVLATNDSATCNVGDGTLAINVLNNDTYSGTPHVEITVGPTLGSAIITVKGSSLRLQYTPPTSGSGGVDTVTYRLTATNSTNYSDAVVSITVSGASDPHVGGVYAGPVSNPQNRDQEWSDFFTLTTTWNGSGSTPIVIYVNPASGAPFGPVPGGAFGMLVSDADFAILDAYCNSGVSTPPWGSGLSIHLTGTDPMGGAGYNATVSYT